MEDSMKNYMATYKFEKKETGFLAKLADTGNPVAEYDKRGRLTKVIDALCLPVQECVPNMIAGCASC